jgi:hypothetical protein
MNELHRFSKDRIRMKADIFVHEERLTDRNKVDRYSGLAPENVMI